MCGEDLEDRFLILASELREDAKRQRLVKELELADNRDLKAYRKIPIENMPR